MEKKQCDLCGGMASMYCESDQANLCWFCDAKVHGANFLVAKHIRCLLCCTCQSLTPWKASGIRLGPSVSMCEPCLRRSNNSLAARNLNLNQDINGCYGEDRFKTEDDIAESYNDDEESDEDEEEEEEAENQVVPWDATAAAQQPLVVSSSSSVSCDGDLVAKRTRRDLDLNCSYEEEIDDSEDSRPMKRVSRNKTSSRSTAGMNAILGSHEKRKSNGCDTSSSCL